MGSSLSPNEERLKQYISSEIVHREPSVALKYLDEKLMSRTYSDDFISWCDEIRSEISNKTRTKTRPIEKKTISERYYAWPKIVHGVLNEKSEKMHYALVEKFLDEIVSDGRDKIKKIKKDQEELRGVISTATASDKYDLKKEYVSLSEQIIETTQKNEQIGETQQKPFFGRFDFERLDRGKKTYYISKTGLNLLLPEHENVSYIDWRAPIADVYYKYHTPANNIKFKNGNLEDIYGNLALTARFDIKNSQIKEISYAARPGDSGMEDLSDAILQKKLRSNSGDHMTEIVETIQPEQNEIIRYTADDNIIIQGVAGSGKTAVALHRIAYLLYQNQDLRDGGIIFVSPNDTFSEYVSNVLPELGEVDIPIKSFDSLLCLRGSKKPESLSAFVERYYRGETNEGVAEKFKLTFEQKFYQVCRGIRKAERMRKEYIEARDEKLALKKDIAAYENSKASITLMIEESERSLAASKERLREAEKEKDEEAIKNANKDKRKYESELHDKKEKLDLTNGVLNELNRRLPSVAREYTEIFNAIREDNETFVFRIQKDSKKDVRLRKTAKQYFEEISGEETINEYSYENVIYVSILKFLVDQVNGKKMSNTRVKQIVIDEAQDYTEPYIRYLKLLYPMATFTILGDINQNINPYHKHRTLQTLLKDAAYFEMNKAYRSSPEIVKYCNKIVGIKNVEPVRASQGEEVELLSSRDLGSDLERIIGSYIDAGYARIGIITKEYDTAQSVSGLVNNEAVYAYPVYVAKGLEFDACIVIDEFNEKEKELFYVSCSRAQHKLTVVRPAEEIFKAQVQIENKRRKILDKLKSIFIGS